MTHEHEPHAFSKASLQVHSLVCPNITRYKGSIANLRNKGSTLGIDSGWHLATTLLTDRHYDCT
jgi:hypothetical protein